MAITLPDARLLPDEVLEALRLRAFSWTKNPAIIPGGTLTGSKTYGGLTDLPWMLPATF